MLSGNWSYPTNIRFGAGRISELAKVCSLAGIQRPLIVTDPGLAVLPMIAEGVETLAAAEMPSSVFSDVKGNPNGDNVDAGLIAFKSGDHDGIIAWGGGSAMDCAKAIALMAGQTLPLWAFEDVGSNWKQADEAAIAPVVAVPTTSGTGSEVGRASVIIDEKTQTKKIIFHPKLLPVTVICDPNLVAGLPKNLTAWTGMDALAHCLEAYCSPIYHPMGDGIAVEGMRLVKEWLPKAVANGSDIEARAHMMAAAAMGAVAFQKGLGAIHALSHPVGAVFDTHHGLTNAVFMPYVLAHNRSAIEGKVIRLARWLDVGDGFDDFMTWVLALRSQFDVPHTAVDLGVIADRLDDLSEMAALDPTASTNPIALDPMALRRLLDTSMSGTLPRV